MDLKSWNSIGFFHAFTTVFSNRGIEMSFFEWFFEDESHKCVFCGHTLATRDYFRGVLGKDVCESCYPKMRGGLSA